MADFATVHDAHDHTGITGVGGSLPAFAGARVHETSTQNIAGTSTWTSLTFSSESFDTDGYHDTGSNTSRLTVPSGKAGIYQIGGVASLAANATGGRQMRLLLNGTTDLCHQNLPGSSSISMRENLVTIYDLAVADYVEIQIWQNSGSTLATVATVSQLWMHLIEHA